ncbi:MAG: TIGR02221 family CRISPR-associated protein [Kiritimatiellae bacterium]|nr:TIGR02221 family CRISPR-associated protein [Kiritimatiellia bacterium]
MKRFISFLGTGNYQLCRYRHGCETSPEVTYVQTATCFFTRCDHAMVFCTVGAKSRHANGLVAEFKQHGLPDAEIVDIPDGASEEQLWTIFRIVRDAVAEDDEIVFDVTHSFRSLPVVMTVLLRYLAVAKGVTLGACLYGAWEARGGDDAPIAPIFDLTPFFALDDWTHAIRGFELFGDASELKNLSVLRLGPLCRNDDAARSLNSTIKQMALFADNVRLANLGTDSEGEGICSLALKNIASHLAKKEIVEGIPELSPILNRVERCFSEYGDNDISNGFRGARWAAAHGLIPQAYTLLQETTVSFVCERFKDMVPETRTGIKVREFVSDVLANAAKNGCDWTRWTPQEEIESARNFAERLGKDLLPAFARLVRRRNALNHAGTNVQEPVSSTSPDYKAEGFCDLADAIEHALMELNSQ